MGYLGQLHFYKKNAQLKASQKAALYENLQLGQDWMASLL